MISNGGKFEMQLHKVPRVVEEHEFFKEIFLKNGISDICTQIKNYV